MTKTGWSIFDIVGPIMIGPSSSHTAGACRLGLMVNRLFGRPDEVVIYLHGSFSKVYKGHGTDKALVAGLLGFNSDNPQLINSFNLANREGMKFSFKHVNFGKKSHPNTVKFEIIVGSENYSLIGASIGGGNISVQSINGREVEGIDGSKELTRLGNINKKYLEYLKTYAYKDVEVIKNKKNGKIDVIIKDSIEKEYIPVQDTDSKIGFRTISALK